VVVPLASWQVGSVPAEKVIAVGVPTVGVTVTEAVVLEQPVAVSVYVNVTLPGATPVIIPALVTVATAILLLIHVPPVAGVREAVFPTQTEAGAVTTGKVDTVIL